MAFQGHLFTMTPQEEVKKIEAIYDEAIKKLEALRQERANLVNQRKDAILKYIKDLEGKKIDAIRTSMGLVSNQQ